MESVAPAGSMCQVIPGCRVWLGFRVYKIAGRECVHLMEMDIHSSRPES